MLMSFSPDARTRDTRESSPLRSSRFSSAYPVFNPYRARRSARPSLVRDYRGPGTKVMRLRGGGAPRTTLICDQSPVWMAWRRTSRYWVSMVESCGVLP